MADCCERYPDFIAISSFLNIFGEQLKKKGENKVPSIWTLKKWIEEDKNVRSRIRMRSNTHPLSEFLLILLFSFTIRNERCTKIEDINKFLISFCLSQGMSKQSYWLRDYGFDMLCIKEKLAILRQLCEFQLEANKHIIACANASKGADIRHEPIGRDYLGNFYWHFIEGRISWIVKELIHPESEPYFQAIRTQQAALQLIDHIKNCKLKKSDKSSEKPVEKSKLEELVLKCGSCKKKFKESQVADKAIHFDNQSWMCPQCEQQQLLNAIGEIFIPEE